MLNLGKTVLHFILFSVQRCRVHIQGSEILVALSREFDEEREALNRKGSSWRMDMLICGMFNERGVKTQGARWLF